jgi:malonate decarboxylase beta subunit
MGLADALVQDSIDKIAAAVCKYVLAGKPTQHRSEQIELYRERIASLDTSQQINPLALREQWTTVESKGGVR